LPGSKKEKGVCLLHSDNGGSAPKGVKSYAENLKTILNHKGSNCLKMVSSGDYSIESFITFIWSNKKNILIIFSFYATFFLITPSVWGSPFDISRNTGNTGPRLGYHTTLTHQGNLKTIPRPLNRKGALSEESGGVSESGCSESRNNRAVKQALKGNPVPDKSALVPSNRLVLFQGEEQEMSKSQQNDFKPSIDGNKDTPGTGYYENLGILHQTGKIQDNNTYYNYL
jgi:hypothetical protein